MTFTGWLVIVAVMAAAMGSAWLVARIAGNTTRRIGYVVVALLPLIAYSLFGLVTGCLPIPEGERCYGYGMGWAILSPFWASWLVAFLIGVGYFHRGQSDRQAK